MSGNLQNLAEHGTGLCLLAVGVGTGSLAISGAVLGTAALETYLKCANRGAKRAAEKALKAMAENAPDLQAADVSAAQSLIQTTPLKMDPQTLALAIERFDAPTVILNTTFGDNYTKAEPGVQAALLAAVSAALQAIRQDEAFDRVFVQDMVIAVLREQGALRQTIEKGQEENRDLHAQTQAMIAELLNKIDNHKLSEALVIALARKYAEGSPMDFEAAYVGLERALEVAAAARERLPGNVSDAVAEVERRVDALNAAGDVDEAEDALWAELERAEAAQLRLVERGLEQVVLTRNVGRAVALEVKKWTLEGGGFGDLRAVFVGWYKRGRDKGLRFDLEVAIGLAEEACGRAVSEDERGVALNDLGLALNTLGERESGDERLEAAVVAYRAALQEQIRDRVPLAWAMTQNNLGNTLQTLGERESGTARLEQAVDAYHAALEEQTRDRMPLGWAGVHNNLGNALRALGQREIGTARLEHAVVAYRAALEERTRDLVPLDWAMTQNNLGNALRALGERESGTARLEQAVDAYHAALEEWTRNRVPLDWATTQNNLGIVLTTLGERESGTARLEQAVRAFFAALEEHTRDRVPLDWAVTQNNLGTALHALGQRENGSARLEQAAFAYHAALEERSRDRVPLGWATTQNNLSELELAFFDKTGDAARLDTAARYAADAREVFKGAGADHYVAHVDGVIAAIAARRAR